jgi:P-type Cu+ transporter
MFLKVGTSLGARRGLLLRGGDVLEKFSEVDAIVFDKTGTLTTGKPVVTKVMASHGESLNSES